MLDEVEVVVAVAVTLEVHEREEQIADDEEMDDNYVGLVVIELLEKLECLLLDTLVNADIL